MDNSKDHIEEFFHASMEQFSERPSEDVWNGLAERLDAEFIPFYQKAGFWKLVFGVQTALLLVVSVVFMSKPSTGEIHDKISQVEAENRSLKNKLDSIQQQKLPEEVSVYTSPAKRVNNLSPDTISRPFTTHFIKKSNQQKIIKSLSNLNSSEARAGSSNSIFTQKRDTVHSQKIAPIPLASQNSLSDTQKSLFTFPKLKLRLPKLNVPGIKFRFKEEMKGNFRLGITGSTLFTFTDQKDRIIPSFNQGIMTEWRISEPFHLVIGVRHSTLNYAINLNESDQSLLLQYPFSEGLPFPALQIHQHIHSLDIPIGIKWYSGKALSRTRTYIEPSLALQYQFGQQHVFTLNGPFGIFKFDPIGSLTQQRFFGMAQLQAGIEKSLTRKWFLQLGLLGKLGLSKFGVERRNIYAFGLQTNIYFSP